VVRPHLRGIQRSARLQPVLPGWQSLWIPFGLRFNQKGLTTGDEALLWPVAFIAVP
jgi:hypothetical protein